MVKSAAELLTVFGSLTILEPGTLQLFYHTLTMTSEKESTKVTSNIFIKITQTHH